MSVSYDVAATLRAQEHGHQPIVCISAGFDGSMGAKAGNIGYEEEKAPTLKAGGSRSGNDLVVYALEGNGSRPSHLGDGYSDGGVSYTLNSVERHAVVYDITGGGSNSMKSPVNDNCFRESEVARTIDSFTGRPECNQGGNVVVEIYPIENHPADSRVSLLSPGAPCQTLSARMGTGGGTCR